MKIYKSILATAILSISSTYVFAEKINDNKEVVDIANAMMQEQRVEDFNNYSTAKSYIQSYDLNISYRFEKLDARLKHDVLKIVRKKNLANSQNADVYLLDNIISDISEEIEVDNQYIGDLTEIEFRSRIQDKLVDYSISIKLPTCDAPLKDFPLNIKYKDKPSNTSYLSAYYFSDVKNSQNEYPCDTEIWYDGQRDNVWANNWLTRQLIIEGYGGNLSKREHGSRTSLIIGVKAAFFGLTGSGLYNRVKIW